MEKLSLNGSDWKFKEFLDEDWVWRDAEKRTTKDARWWKSAEVPGSVLNDLYKNDEVPNPYQNKNSLLMEWAPERTWVYRKSFRIPKAMLGKNIQVCFEGVDYSAQIYFNDIFLGRHESMFTAFKYEITDLIEWQKENLLVVVIEKAPDEQSQVSKTRYVHTHKSRMNYWWDFCPRMIHQGIWRDVYLRAFDGICMNQITFENELTADLKHASLDVKVAIDKMRLDKNIDFSLQCKLFDKEKLISEAESQVIMTNLHQNHLIHLDIENPILWWPNEYGEQHLYCLEVSLFFQGSLLQQESFSTGFRIINFTKNTGAPPDARAYTLNVNGKTIYMKGWNWVPIDVMYGKQNLDKLEHLLRLLKDAHVNIIRIWGGGLIESEKLYSLCDKYGILIWQEFILSSSGIEDRPSTSPDYLQLMEQEAQQIIPSRKNHLSLVIWCGGNELRSENQSIIKDTEPVVQVLRKQVNILDNKRLFLPSSPSGGVSNNTLENIRQNPDSLHDVHGPWEHQGLQAQYQLYNEGTSLLSSEFGVEGMAHEATLRYVMNNTNLWPPSKDNPYYFHRGSWWNNYEFLQTVCDNRLEQLADVIHISQLLQYEGLRYAVESNRLRAMHSSGSFPWQFNEPYPNNTCTSSVDYYGIPKPAYYGVKEAYAVNHLSARFASQTWENQESFNAEVFFSSSWVQSKAVIKAEITDLYGKELCSKKVQVKTNDEKATQATCLNYPVAEISTEVFFLILSGVLEDGHVIETRYLFTKGNLAALLDLEKASVEITKTSSESYCIRNRSQVAAIGVLLDDDSAVTDYDYVRYSENYFYLLGNEEKTVEISGLNFSSFRPKVHGINVIEYNERAEE